MFLYTKKEVIPKLSPDALIIWSTIAWSIVIIISKFIVIISKFLNTY